MLFISYFNLACFLSLTEQCLTCTLLTLASRGCHTLHTAMALSPSLHFTDLVCSDFVNTIFYGFSWHAVLSGKRLSRNTFQTQTNKAGKYF